MYEGWRREAWDHTALIGSILINANLRKGAKPVKMEELNPLRARGGKRGMPLTKQTAHLLFAAMGKAKRDGR